MAIYDKEMQRAGPNSPYIKKDQNIRFGSILPKKSTGSKIEELINNVEDYVRLGQSLTNKNSAVPKPPTNSGSSANTNKKSTASKAKAKAPTSTRTQKEKVDYTPLIEMFKTQTAETEAKEKEAHAQRMQSLESLYNESRANRDKNYNNNLKQTNDENEQMMRKLYIESMLSKRNNAQSLAAQGLNGGFSQSTEMGLQRDYENKRLQVQNENKKLLDKLNGAYSEQNTSALNEYEAEKAKLIDGLNKSITSLQEQLLKTIAKYY